MAKTHNSLMFDIETFSQIPTAAIASIGAVVFNQEDGIVDRFYVNISPADTKRLGFHFDPKTIEWWKNKPKEVQEALMINPASVKEAVISFNDFYKRNKCSTSWCWGSSFDHAIYAYTCHVIGEQEPWPYYEQRCARTLGKVFGIEPKRDSGHHNAMVDAEAQAEMLIEFYKQLAE